MMVNINPILTRKYFFPQPCKRGKGILLEQDDILLVPLSESCLAVGKIEVPERKYFFNVHRKRPLYPYGNPLGNHLQERPCSSHIPIGEDESSFQSWTLPPCSLRIPQRQAAYTRDQRVPWGLKSGRTPDVVIVDIVVVDVAIVVDVPRVVVVVVVRRTEPQHHLVGA